MAKRMSGNQSQFTIPTLTDQNKEFTTPNEKANLFAQHFAAVSSDDNYTSEFKSIKNLVKKLGKPLHPHSTP